MMAEKEYIERKAVLDELLYAMSGTGFQSRAMDAVHFVPAADVAPVVHAEWEFRNDGRYRQTRCYCSACGKHSGIGGIRENQKKPYCPNCGARMDGGKDG